MIDAIGKEGRKCQDSFEIVEHEYICQCADRGCGAGTLSAEEIAEVDSLYLVGAGWNPAAVPVSIRDDI